MECCPTLSAKNDCKEDDTQSQDCQSILSDSNNARSLGKCCSTCGLNFKGERGLRIHVAKKHPLEANSLTLKTILKEQNTLKAELCEDSNINKETKKWALEFRKLKENDQFTTDKFDEAVRGFLGFLKAANSQLPGPQHPAVRFYQARKRKKLAMQSKGARQVSNPQRANKAARERRREQYQYEVAQYNYYNRRRKVVHDVMNADAPKQCPIKVSEVERHFRETFSIPNERGRSTYEKYAPLPNVMCVDIQQIRKAIKSTALDTSPGLDGVLIRTLKCVDVAHIIKYIAEIMLMTAYVPEPLRQGRTILIRKGKGDVSLMSSWRPITIYSVVRRIIEKVLDVELKKQISFHPSQRGFINGLPGAHVNTRLINAILQDAKNRKGDCAIAFLDVTGAFDNVGHGHIVQSLTARGVSPDLRDIIAALLCNNEIRISAGVNATNAIEVHRGVPQGGPLSSSLFNLAIDHVYREVCDPGFSNNFGYRIKEDLDCVTLTGFADDQAISARDPEAAERIVNCVQKLFGEIGLKINPVKSAAIVVDKGELRVTNLVLENGESIVSIGQGETIKYLGCTFSGELDCNENAITKLSENLGKLVTSNLLKPEQKLNVVNQYVFPTLIYPLQTAPLVKLNPTLLEGVDTIIRRSVKAMLGLTANASSAMLYAPRKYRGLGLVRCQWEAPLQHLSIAQRLSSVVHNHFQATFDYDKEMAECMERLKIECLDGSESVRRLRQMLRERAFNEWCDCKWQGVGVRHFKDTPKANKFICDKQILTGSEWTNAIKLNVNYAPLRGVPGISGQTGAETGPLCRKCNREIESPAHVLGICPNNMLQVTRRHHNVKSKIANLLREKGFTCYDEVYCIDTEGSTRYADIVAFHSDNKSALIIDPTIRYESNDPDQADKIDAEKKKIYMKCIPYLQERFNQKFGERKYTVRGLWFGSRGTIPKLTSAFLQEIGTDPKELPLLTESILLDSLGILHHHIYGT